MALSRPPAARSALFRGATVAMFLSGLGFSAAAPQIASFLVNDLGGSLTAAGLFYLTNLTAPVAGYLVGARSDRTGGRLGLFRACAVAGFVGWAAIAFSTHLWMPYVISALVLAFAVGAAVVGLPLVFLIPATLAFLAAVGLAVMARSALVPSAPTTRRDS